MIGLDVLNHHVAKHGRRKGNFMKATIKIEMDNAAFSDEPGYELSRILRELARDVECDGFSTRLNLRDLNGNVVGRFTVTGKRN